MTFLLFLYNKEFPCVVFMPISIATQWVHLFQSSSLLMLPFISLALPLEEALSGKEFVSPVQPVILLVTSTCYMSSTGVRV
jgi:hypothetical protein